MTDPWALPDDWGIMRHKWKLEWAEHKVKLAHKSLGYWTTREEEVRREVLERSKGAPPRPWDCQYIRWAKRRKKAMRDNLRYWEGILAGLSE